VPCTWSEWPCETKIASTASGSNPGETRARRDLSGGKAGLEQDRGVARAHERRIALTAAAENGDLHVRSPYDPVCPKPPSPRAVGGSSAASTKRACETGTDEHLRDPVPALDGHRLATQIDEKDLHLAAVIRIDGTGRVGERDAEARREPAARPDLGLQPSGTATRIPVGTAARSPGPRTTGASMQAARSAPALPAVA
jgi:hypothetical protein